MKPKFIVQADAGPLIGAGHIMRCLPLIEALTELKYEVEVLGTIINLPWVIDALTNTGVKIHNSSDKLDISISTNDVLILDSYTLPVESPLILNKKWSKIIVIGDLYTPNYLCDLFINMSMSQLARSSKSRARNFLSGPEYIMTRNEIIKAKSSANLQQVLKQKILVSGGASDFENFTHEVVKKLMMIDFNFEVCVFSKQSPNFFHDSRFTFKSLGSDLVKEIEGVNLFISTAGTSAFDFLTLGGVLALGCAVENQIENYVQLQVNGLAIGVGECDKNGVWNLDSEKLNSFLADKELQDKLIARSKNLFKGEGAMKITNEILNLVL